MLYQWLQTYALKAPAGSRSLQGVCEPIYTPNKNWLFILHRIPVNTEFYVK